MLIFHLLFSPAMAACWSSCAAPAYPFYDHDEVCRWEKACSFSGATTARKAAATAGKLTWRSCQAGSAPSPP